MPQKSKLPAKAQSLFSHKALDQAITESTARAYRRDLDYFWAWVQTLHPKKRIRPKYPVPLPLLFKFADVHLSGISDATVKGLAAQGIGVRRRPWSVKTLKRALATLSVEHSLRAADNHCWDKSLRIRINRAKRLKGEADKKSRPITIDVLKKLLSACDNDLRGTRDKAVLLVAFGGGGRRRSEIARLRMEDLEPVDDGYLATLKRHKTVRHTGEALKFPILGKAAKALDRWLEMSGIESGPLFRGVHRGGHLRATMEGQTVYRMIKRLARKAGLPPDDYGAHSLRSGFMTQAAREGIALPEAMAVSHHRTVAVAWGYYRAGNILENRATRIMTDRLRLTG